jgi:ABC-type Fe3+-hydroxamate transport system substrate-binding protein
MVAISRVGRDLECDPSLKKLGRILHYQEVLIDQRREVKMQTNTWVCLCVLAVLLIGCGERGSTGGAARSADRRKSKSSEMPVVEVAADSQARTLRHGGGTTEDVPAKPCRVVALNTSDAAYFLGFAPVAETVSWNMRGSHYLDPYRKDVGRVGAAYGTRMASPESVMSFAPDLIIMDSLDGVALSQMQKLAPTVVVRRGTASVTNELQIEEHTADVGLALGIPARTQAALRWLRYKVELASRDMRAYFAKEFGDRIPAMTVLWPNWHVIRVYYSPLVYNSGLGFVKPKPIQWFYIRTSGSPTYDTMDYEQLADIEAEYLVCLSYNRIRGPLPGRTDHIERSPLRKHLQAVKNDRVLGGNIAEWRCDGPLSFSLCLNELVRLVLPLEHQTPELQQMLKDRPDDGDIAEVARWPSDRGMISWTVTSDAESKQSPRKGKSIQPGDDSAGKRKGHRSR